MNSRPADRAVTLIPALVAAALAVVYVTGSVNAAGALSQDGLSVMTVRLFSLEQLLVRGVSVWTQPELALGSGVLFALMWAIARFSQSAAWRSKLTRPSDSGRSGPPRALLLALAVNFVAFLALTLFLPLKIVAIAIPFSLLFIGIEISRARLAIRPVEGGSADHLRACRILAANYAIAFPQPVAVTELRSGAPGPSGIFVTHVDSTWFIAIKSDVGKRIRAIPETHLRDVQLIYRDDEASAGHSLYQRLAGS